jgi:hypothetical protein
VTATPPTAVSDAPIAWARTWATARPFARPMPRRGAWYGVYGETSGDRLILEIRGRKVAVGRRFLEVREARPKSFTVVARGQNEPNPAHGTDEDLGRTYAVCPSCSSRNGLFGKPVLLVCDVCSHRGEIAWWESG